MALKKERVKTAYPGVYYREDDQTGKRSYYIRYRRGGRDSELHEERIKEKGVTPKIAADIRERKIRGEYETNEEKRYYSENGISDFIMAKINKPLMKAPIFAKASNDTDEVEIAFIWTGGTGASYVFANGGYCVDGGTPNTGAKTAITNGIKNHR